MLIPCEIDANQKAIRNLFRNAKNPENVISAADPKFVEKFNWLCSNSFWTLIVVVVDGYRNSSVSVNRMIDLFANACVPVVTVATDDIDLYEAAILSAGSDDLRYMNPRSSCYFELPRSIKNCDWDTEQAVNILRKNSSWTYPCTAWKGNNTNACSFGCSELVDLGICDIPHIPSLNVEVKTTTRLLFNAQDDDSVPCCAPDPDDSVIKSNDITHNIDLFEHGDNATQYCHAFANTSNYPDSDCEYEENDDECTNVAPFVQQHQQQQPPLSTTETAQNSLSNQFATIRSHPLQQDSQNYSQWQDDEDSDDDDDW